MKRLVICIMAVSALSGLMATTSGAKSKKKCASKHEKSGCVLTKATYVAKLGPGQGVGVIASPHRFVVVLSRVNSCATTQGGIQGPPLKIGKTISFSGPGTSGSLKVTAKSGTLTLKTHRDALPPNPNLGPGNQGSPACDTNQTFTLHRSS